MLCDWLVTGQVVAPKPAHTVRDQKHVVKGGKITVLTADQACERLDSIDITPLAAHTPAKQKVIIHEMPLGVASDWDTFAQACNVTFMCSHANVSAERLRSHVRFFAAYLEGAKVAQCAVAFRRFGKTREIGRFVDGMQLLPEYAALWGQIMQGMLRILGPGRYYYGTEWSIEEDRTNDLTALHGITIQTVFPYVIHGVDFSRWPSWEAYRQAISNNARRNAAKALKSDPKVEILIDYGSRTILDTIPFMRMRSRMRHRKGLDFNVLEQAMRYVTRMLLMRKHGYTARVVHLGKVVSYFCGIDFGRHTFYTYGASAPEKNGASWLLILDMLQRSWKPGGKFLMGQAETDAGRDNLFLFRQHCRVSDFPSAIVRFTYEP